MAVFSWDKILIWAISIATFGAHVKKSTDKQCKVAETGSVPLWSVSLLTVVTGNAEKRGSYFCPHFEVDQDYYSLKLVLYLMLLPSNSVVIFCYSVYCFDVDGIQ